MTRPHKVYRSIPWRTAPHPWFSFVAFALVVISALVGIVIGIFGYHAPGTETPPTTSYVQTTTLRGTP